MKTLKTILACLILSKASFGQVQKLGNPEARAAELKKIQAMEMAFITKELNLSPDEAQKFWPVFNQYRNELRSVATENKQKDHLEKQQKMLDLRKKYREDFSKVMNQERANKVFGAEDEFKSLVRREFQKRQEERRKMEPRKKGF
ncbi:MAG: hypothetical protein RL282_2003 [Bacteroidota bacterium]|jgi:hypothetical protein